MPLKKLLKEARDLIIIIILCCLPAAPLQAQFIAIPPEAADRYRIDFKKIFYIDRTAEVRQRSEFYHLLSQLEAYKDKAINSARSLLRVLQLRDEAEVEFLRHYNYLYLLAAVDTADTAAAEASDLDAEFQRRTGFVQSELRSLNDAQLARLLATAPALKTYRFAIESARRYQPHSLGEKEEGALAALAPSTSEWQYDLYSKLIQKIDFGRVRTTDGDDKDVRRQRSAIASDPDRSVREKGFRRLYEGYASQRDIFAFALINTAKARNCLAKLHRFRNAADEVYFGRYLSEQEVKGLLEHLADQSQVYKHYQRLRADQIKKRLRYSDVNIWDLSAPSPATPLPRFTISEASSIIKQALAPLGDEYGRELTALLDPANGRMDIVPGQNRKGGGFSSANPGKAALFYSGGFEGYYNDVRVLAHESTHAIQRQLMSNDHVPSVYTEGPHYLSESFAIFNEILLVQFLAEHEKNPERRQHYLEQFLDRQGMAPFAVAPDAEFEQALFERVDAGSLKNSDDLDAISKRINSKYSIWATKHDELKMRWIADSLMYEDLLYEINYVYGALLALKFYELYRNDPAHFMPRYIGLMRRGFDAPPDQMLKASMGIDIRDSAFVYGPVQLLEKKVGELELEYGRDSRPTTK